MPFANRILVYTQAFRNLLALQALSAPQDYLASIRQATRRSIVDAPEIQEASIKLAQNNEISLCANHEKTAARVIEAQ